MNKLQIKIKNIILYFLFKSSIMNKEISLQVVDSYPVTKFYGGVRMINSTNMVLCLRSSNQYFKECRYHEDKKSFINTIVCDFFDNIYISPLLSKVDSCLLKEAIINNLSDKRAFTSFFYMGRKIRRAIESEDYSLVGLPSIVKQYSSKVIVDFLKYSISEISNYRRNAGIHGFHSYNSNRALSQYKVAEILGVKWLMPKIEYAKIKVDEGPIRFGILSMAVEGVDPTYVDNKRFKFRK